MADRQHGVVATWQLAKLGLDWGAVSYRARIGRLHRKYRGVYSVGRSRLAGRGEWMAAVLAYGPDALLSHHTAAALWEIGSPGPKIHVTTPHYKRSRGRVRAHTTRVLHPEEMTRHDGFPVTSVARTILDLAATFDRSRLTRVIETAVRAGLFDLNALDRATARRPGAPGIKRLRAVLDDYRGAPDLRSELERDFRALIQRAGLPEPQYNALVAGLTVDVYWPAWKLVVELDGRGYHASPRAFETDRIRDAKVQKVGCRVLRVTHKRMRQPAAVLADIVALRR